MKMNTLKFLKNHRGSSPPFTFSDSSRRNHRIGQVPISIEIRRRRREGSTSAILQTIPSCHTYSPGSRTGRCCISVGMLLKILLPYDAAARSSCAQPFSARAKCVPFSAALDDRAVGRKAV